MYNSQVNPAGVDEGCWEEIFQASDADFCRAPPADNQLLEDTIGIAPYDSFDEMRSPTVSFGSDWILWDNELERQATQTTDIINLAINCAIFSSGALTNSSDPASSNASSPAVPPFVQYINNSGLETAGVLWDNSEIDRQGTRTPVIIIPSN